MDVGAIASAGVSTVMVAAAGALGSALPQQDAVMRGSLATQSLAADLANTVEVVQGMEGVAEVVQGVTEEVQSSGMGGSLWNLGNKALEIFIVQTIAATVLVMVNKVLNSCGNRRVPQEPFKDTSPGISPIPVHHRIDSENSESFQDHEDTLYGMDGTYPSDDLNDLSLDTIQVRERGIEF